MKRTKMLTFLLIGLLILSALGLAGCQTNNPTTTASTPVTVQTSVVESTADYSIIEATCERDGLKIYGRFVLPANLEGQVQTVIFSHGFNGRYMQGVNVGKDLAMQGIATYSFDFIGGAMKTDSDGLMSDMSLLTEKADLNAVIDFVKTFAFVDPDNLFLAGASQGGAVSALTAADRPADIKALILMYPALCITDDWQEMYPDPDKIPESIDFMGGKLGKRYAIDAIGIDMYGEIAKYTQDVLIFHGTADTIVDYTYAEKAIETYQSAELVTIEGGGHAFNPDQTDLVNQQIIAFILDHKN